MLSADREEYYHPSPNIPVLLEYLLRLSVPPNWTCPIRQKGKFGMPQLYPECLSFQSPLRQLKTIHKLAARSGGRITVPSLKVHM